MTSQESPPTIARPILGIIGFVCGGVALLAVLVHFAAGPFAPVQDSAVTLGEFTARMGKAAFRDIFGLAQPEPETLGWDVDRILKFAIMAVGGLAVLLGLAAFLRRESRKLAFSAVSLGAAAVAMQTFTLVLAMILGTIVICSLIYTLGDILSFG